MLCGVLVARRSPSSRANEVSEQGEDLRSKYTQVPYIPPVVNTPTLHNTFVSRQLPKETVLRSVTNLIVATVLRQSFYHSQHVCFQEYCHLSFQMDQ